MGEGTLGRYVEAVNMQEYIYPANYVKDEIPGKS